MACSNVESTSVVSAADGSGDRHPSGGYGAQLLRYVKQSVRKTVADTKPESQTITFHLWSLALQRNRSMMMMYLSLKRHRATREASPRAAEYGGHTQDITHNTIYLVVDTKRW